MNNPFVILKDWINEEGLRGAPNPQQAVLSSISPNNVPHSRVVAIREISSDALIFFTQRETRKVFELNENPHAAITFWFELYQRSVSIEGEVESLSQQENEQYWENYPREAQIRFHSYAPTSTQTIISKQMLQDKMAGIREHYQDNEIPISPFYLGFRFKPRQFIFYTYRLDELSDVVQFTLVEDWQAQILSP